MSPVLHFNFVSKLYSGSISDKEIVNVSGFLEKLQLGDTVMADKGFNIQDYLTLHETVLIAPPIMRKNNTSASINCYKTSCHWKGSYRTYDKTTEIF